MKRSDDKLKHVKLKKIGFCLVEICETRVALNLISFGLTKKKKKKKKFQSNKLQVNEYVNSNKSYSKGIKTEKNCLMILCLSDMTLPFKQSLI